MSIQQDHPRCVSCVHWGEPGPDGLAWCVLSERMGGSNNIRTRPEDMCEMHTSAEQAART